MKLVFYGGGDSVDNIELDEHLISMASREMPIKSLRMTYIPACSYYSGLEFNHFVRRFKPFGIHRFLNLRVDAPFDNTLLEHAFNSEIIYLGGGNTFEFLKNLQKRKLLNKLREYVMSGGILAGLSAGGLIMSPHIELAGYPSFDCDDNDVNLMNLRSLKLVKFEFFPHYRNSKRYNQALLDYSQTSNHSIYACPDGGGIVLDGESTTFVGKCSVFHQGLRVPLF